MPVGLDKLKKKIWGGLKGKINPRTKKPYTESDAWAIATAQWKKSGKSLSVGIDDDFESESDMLQDAVKQLSGGDEDED